MSHPPTSSPNPRRVAAGQCNRRLRQGLSEAGRVKLSRGALSHRPWEHSTGPRTPSGKAKVAANGRLSQVGPYSVRELREKTVEARMLVRRMRELRGLISSIVSPGLETDA